MKKFTEFLRAVFLFPFNILMGMASGAISAQGSQFFMGTGTGGAITVTAISKAFNAEVTGTHTLAVGDRVTFASVGGMTEINALVGTVTQITGTTKFCVNINSLGFGAYTSAGTATPVTWTQIKELKDLKASDATVPKLDKTNLDSTIEEVSPGLPTAVEITATVNIVTTDPGAIAARAAFLAGTEKQFKFVLPNGVTLTFQGYFSKFPLVPSGSVNTLVSGSMAVQTDGVITQA